MPEFAIQQKFFKECLYSLKQGDEKMTISATEVFDKVAEYVRKNYKEVESIRMPYVSLTEDYLIKKKIYRVQLEIKLKDEKYPKSAIGEVDAETGNIIMFKEGYTWQYWI